MQNFAPTTYSSYSISLTSFKISSSRPRTYQRFYESFGPIRRPGALIWRDKNQSQVSTPSSYQSRPPLIQVDTNTNLSGIHQAHRLINSHLLAWLNHESSRSIQGLAETDFKKQFKRNNRKKRGSITGRRSAVAWTEMYSVILYSCTYIIKTWLDNWNNNQL